MITYLEIADLAAERIYLACQRSLQGENRIKAILDAYNPKGSTRHVSFNTSKDVYRTLAAEMPRELRGLRQRLGGGDGACSGKPSQVRAYVKNQGMQFEVPYRMGQHAPEISA